MTMQITSTTDSPEAVRAAMGFVEKGAKMEGAAQSAPEAENAPVQNESEESDTPETEATEEASEESEDAAAEEAEESKDEAKDKPKKKGGFQKRIDKLNGRVSAAEAAAMAARAEAEQLRTLLAQRAGDSKNATQVETTKAAPQEGKPKLEEFATLEDYTVAVADWAAEQRFKSKDAEATKAKAESDRQALLKAHYARETAFAAKTPDYAETLADVRYFQDAPKDLVDLVAESEHGPQIMYELAKNTDEYARIKGLSAVAAAREIGKLESRFSQASEKKDPEKRITKAPAPLSTVHGKGKVEKDPDSMEYGEFKKWREEKLARR
jgi:hypothetical protein